VRGTHSFYIESHGRHSETLDLSETVGWFTEIYPLALEQPSKDAIGCIEYVKQKYRGIPSQGLGYGVLRYLSNDGALTERAQQYAPQVVFNYFGQVDGLARDSGLLEFSPDPCGPIACDELQMPYKLIFQGGVFDGCLMMKIEYDQRRFYEADIRSLADAVEVELLRLTGDSL
jgi:non-ribosomal peptide synthase protein (TIGR01720 family)